MKVITENTIRVNPRLYSAIVREYNTVVQTYHWMKQGANSTEINHPVVSGLMKFFDEKGGMKFFRKMYDTGATSLFANIEIKEILKVTEDPILSKRRLSQEQLEQKIDELGDEYQNIYLCFYFQNPKIPGMPSESKGEFSFNDEKRKLKNVFYIGLDGSVDLGKMTPELKGTIRHELQHFTQFFYGHLLGIGFHKLGFPSKDIKVSYPPERDSEEYKKFAHQDIPWEIATDLQDEIDWFKSFVKKENLYSKDGKKLKDAILEFVGISGNNQLASHVFLHYFKTNKKLWRWATSKLLSSLEKM